MCAFNLKAMMFRGDGVQRRVAQRMLITEMKMTNAPKTVVCHYCAQRATRDEHN
jgi:hypothetical protein